MIKVQLYRVGREYGNCNREKKGSFSKEFRNVSELAKFLCSARYVFMIPGQLSDSERVSLNGKYLALLRSEARNR